jgi:hypothetical protein
MHHDPNAFRLIRAPGLRLMQPAGVAATPRLGGHRSSEAGFAGAAAAFSPHPKEHADEQPA